jgi:hypothetical protein
VILILATQIASSFALEYGEMRVVVYHGLEVLVATGTEIVG